jgi:hypothetical protein
MVKFARICWSFSIIAVLSIAVACSGPAGKLPSVAGDNDGRSALIRSGPHTRIESLDDRRLKSSSLSVAAQPGSHILSVSFVSRTVGYRLLYATQNASLSVVVKAGRRYTVYAEEVPESAWAGVIVKSYNWVAYVKDNETGENVAESEPLPLREEHVFPPSYHQEP